MNVHDKSVLSSFSVFTFFDFDQNTEIDVDVLLWLNNGKRCDIETKCINKNGVGLFEINNVSKNKQVPSLHMYFSNTFRFAHFACRFEQKELKLIKRKSLKNQVLLPNRVYS